MPVGYATAVLPGLTTLTVAVKVTDCPDTVGLVDEATVVPVLALLVATGIVPKLVRNAAIPTIDRGDRVRSYRQSRRAVLGHTGRQRNTAGRQVGVAGDVEEVDRPRRCARAWCIGRYRRGERHRLPDNGVVERGADRGRRRVLDDDQAACDVTDDVVRIHGAVDGDQIIPDRTGGRSGSGKRRQHRQAARCVAVCESAIRGGQLRHRRTVDFRLVIRGDQEWHRGNRQKAIDIRDCVVGIRSTTGRDRVRSNRAGCRGRAHVRCDIRRCGKRGRCVAIDQSAVAYGERRH